MTYSFTGCEDTVQKGLCEGQCVNQALNIICTTIDDKDGIFCVSACYEKEKMKNECPADEGLYCAQLDENNAVCAYV